MISKTISFRSLLDVLSETSSLAKCYTLMCMIPVLDADEIRTLSEALPPELSFLRKKGLVHLLPPYICKISDHGATEGYHSISQPEIYDRDLQYSDSFFSLPSHLQQASHLTGIDLEAVYPRSGFLVSPNSIGTTAGHRRSHCLIDSNENCTAESSASVNPPRLRVQRGVTDMSSTASISTGVALQSIELTQRNFESTLQDLVERKSKLTSDWIAQQTSSAISASLRYLASGGSMSDEFMIIVLGACTFGATAANFHLGKSQEPTLKMISNLPHANNGASLQGIVKYAINHTAKCAFPCMVAAAVTTGSMLAVRNIRRVSACSSKFRLSVSNLLVCCRDYIRRAHLKPFSNLLTGDHPLLLIAISAWAVTAFIVLQLNLRARNSKWIYNSVVAKMLRSYVDTFRERK